MRGPLARIDVEHDGAGGVLVTVAGEIDLSNADQLRKDLDAAVIDAHAVVVDLTAVDYLDSQGVQLLYATARRLAGRGAELAVVSPTDSVVGEVLAVAGLDHLVPVREHIGDLWSVR